MTIYEIILYMFIVFLFFSLTIFKIELVTKIYFKKLISIIRLFKEKDIFHKKKIRARVFYGVKALNIYALAYVTKLSF